MEHSGSRRFLLRDASWLALYLPTLQCSATHRLLTLQLGEKGHVTTYELTLLFTIFVMTHFFYLFNARAFETGRSALHFKGCSGLITIVIIILVGQVAMVEIPGIQHFFNVCGLKLQDWIIIIIGSSLVLWVRELWHLVTRKSS